MKITLYKKQDKGNKIQVWTIEVKGDQYRSTEGFEGGAMTTSEWTTAKPKNVGRSNATTGAEQAFSEAQAKVTLKLNKGYVETKELLGTSSLGFRPMLAHKYKDHIKKVEFPCISQPKLDGMRCNVTKDGMFSREGKPILSAPHIYETLKPIFDEYPTYVFDGELYNHKLKADFNTIISLVKKMKPTPYDLKECEEKIQYHVYDLYDSANPNDQAAERLHELIPVGTFYLKNKPQIVLVSTSISNDQDSLDQLYTRYLNDGYEGQMIRSLKGIYKQGRSADLLKRKEFQDAEYEITDIEEGIGNRSNMMGKIHLVTPKGEKFESNALGDIEYYKELLNNKESYIGKKATVRFQALTPRGVPRFPIVSSIRDYE